MGDGGGGGGFFAKRKWIDRGTRYLDMSNKAGADFASDAEREDAELMLALASEVEEVEAAYPERRLQSIIASSSSSSPSSSSSSSSSSSLASLASQSRAPDARFQQELLLALRDVEGVRVSAHVSLRMRVCSRCVSS
eukprot:3697617-Rhodomonas_salina.3